MQGEQAYDFQARERGKVSGLPMNLRKKKKCRRKRERNICLPDFGVAVLDFNGLKGGETIEGGGGATSP